MIVNQKIPNLRFPEFDGEWEDTFLDSIGEYIGGGTPKTSIQEYWQGEIPWISSSDIIENDIHNINIQKYITEDAVINSATKKIPARSLIIVSRVGVGKFAINSSEVCTSQDFTNIIIDKDLYNPNFAAYNLYKNIEVLFNISQGTSIKGFTITELKKTKLPFPTLPEQTKIASFLTAVDDKLHALKQKHALLEQYKKGVMQQLFSGKLRFKDENGNDYPDWEEKKIKDIFIVTRGNVLSMTLVSNEQNEQNIYPVYSSQTKNKGLSGFYNNFLFEDCITWTTDGAGAGDVNFRKGKFYCTNVCGVLKSDKGYANNFVSEILNSVSRKYVSYVGNPKLMNNVMSEIKISIPISIKEQTKIANFLSAIDEKINQCQAQIAKTEVWKKGLLQQLFV